MTEKEKFCESIKKHEKAMYRVAYCVVKNDADCAEVISESIYRAYNNLSSLKNYTVFKSWILKIVHNTAVEYVRKNAKYVGVDELNDIQEPSKSEDLETKIALRQAVESLNQPYRTVVVLFYYENLSTNEIAQITESSIVTVRKQLQRARTMLKELLKEDFKNE